MKKKANYLEQMRLRLNLRQEDLAEMFGIERSTYAKIEKNPARCSLQLADLIASRLDVPVEYLFSNLFRHSPLPSKCLLEYLFPELENHGGYDTVVTLEDLKMKGIIADDASLPGENEDD